MIELDGLTKSFPGPDGKPVPAVDDLTFTVNPGEVFGLLGPNGAGKTTTLRMLCTVLRPTAGFATIAGHDVMTDPSAVRR
ncbi:MAG: ATP-binding cassette domain-containing protein, partial [Gemmataceae bacterium]